MQVRAEAAITANPHGLPQVFDGLGPVAGVSRFQPEIAELLDAVRELALLFQLIETDHVLLRFRLPGLAQRLRQIVEGLGARGIRLNGEAKVLDRFVRLAEPQQVLPEQGLRVGIARGELHQMLQQGRRALHLAGLSFNVGQQVQRSRIVRL